MALVIDKIRRWVKGTNSVGVVPTIPVSNDHTDGSWIATDIYDREMFVNTNDLAVYIRCGGSVLRINNNVASSVNTDTTNFTKNLSAADTTVQHALQTFNNANLGHVIKDNGTVKPSHTNLNFIGFNISEDIINDAIVIQSVASVGALVFQGDWNANTNSPSLTGTIITGYFWKVSVAGSTNLGGITTWNVGDFAIKTASSWMKDENPATSDDVPEGSTNKYFLSSRVLSSVLTGLSTATNQDITATDTVLSAFGYLQKQISDNLASVTPEISAINIQNPATTSTDFVSGRRFWSGITQFLANNGNVFSQIVQFTLGLNILGDFQSILTKYFYLRATLNSNTANDVRFYGDSAGFHTEQYNGTSWIDISNLNVFNAQTGTTYTLALTDSSKLVTCSNAAAITVTVPPNSSVAFPIGTQVDVIQKGVGKVTLAQGSGVTINSLGSLKSIAGQNVGVSLIKEATDTWYLIGNLIS